MSPPPPPPLIDFHRLSVMRGEKTVLRRFSVRVNAGEHVAILGPNGSGKSTLIKLMTGELYPLADVPGARFRLLGHEQWALDEVRRRIGLVALDLLQSISREVTSRVITAREMVLSGFFESIGLWPHHRVQPEHERRARAVLSFLEISHLANRPLAEMSSGEQRRTIIGRALVHDPEALVLDEPTNSLDPGAVREFRVLLRKLARSGRTLILVTHHVADLIPEIDRVVLLQHGRIVADGPPRRVVTSAALSRLFGARLKVVRRVGQYHVVSAS